MIREVSFGLLTLYFIATGAEVPATAPVPSRTSAMITLSFDLSSPISTEKFPLWSVCADFTFAPLSLILIALVGFDVPLTVIVFVETVVFELGSLMVISDFTGGGSSFDTAVISNFFSISSAVSSSKTVILYLPAFLSVNPF